MKSLFDHIIGFLEFWFFGIICFPLILGLWLTSLPFIGVFIVSILVDEETRDDLKTKLNRFRD